MFYTWDLRKESGEAVKTLLGQQRSQFEKKKRMGFVGQLLMVYCLHSVVYWKAINKLNIKKTS